MPPKPAHLFPPSNAPRTWLITSAPSPIGLRLSRSLLDHGDNLVLCVSSAELQRLKNYRSNGNAGASRSQDERLQTFSTFINGEAVERGWRARTRVVALDGRAGQCQAAVATAIDSFGCLDILFCCSSEVIGTVEELSASNHTMTLVREQFETNFFGPINIMKAVLPAMRDRKSGHIINLTCTTGHLGTPGLGAYCSSTWAIEGFCDSLAYEIAPFNIKLTIIQPSYEVSVLINQISAAPAMAAYTPPLHPAPLSRTVVGRLIDRIEGVQGAHTLPANSGNSSNSEADTDSPNSSRINAQSTESQEPPLSLGSTNQVTTLVPNLPAQMLASFLAETVHALIAIGGHENPPARHIVGFEAIASVKEKLKTVSEELEDFVDCSSGVDIEMVYK